MGVFALMPALDPHTAPSPIFVNGWSSLHAALDPALLRRFWPRLRGRMMFLTQEHDLKFHKLRAILSRLPPIQRLEKVASGLVIAGFVLLTAGLSIYPMLDAAKAWCYSNMIPRLIPSFSGPFSSGALPVLAGHALAWTRRTAFRLGRAGQFRFYSPDLLGIHPVVAASQFRRTKQNPNAEISSNAANARICQSHSHSITF